MNVQAEKIKVACVGNSITGFHQYNYYATPLQAMLGDEYLVDNFGKGGSGIFKKYREDLNEREWSYINSSECQAALEFNPDMVIIKFGANDASQTIFTALAPNGKQLFKEDYTLLINKFRELPSNPKIFICIPPAMFYGEDGFFGSFSNQIMRDYIQPAVKELAEELDLGLIDFYTPTKDHPEFMPGDVPNQFPDWVHPDHRGHYVMALAAYEAIAGRSFERPFVEGEFIPDPEKEYYIRNRRNGYVLNCDANEVGYLVNTAPYDKEKEEKQLFKFENFSYNIYRIRHVASNFQLKNLGSGSVRTGNDAGNEPLKYGMYIKPVEDKYHTIGCNDMSLLGLVQQVYIVGDRKLSDLTEGEQWEFIEKDDMEELSGLDRKELSEVKISGQKGRILFENLERVNRINIFDMIGNSLGRYEVNSLSFSVNMNPGVYLISLNNFNREAIKVFVK